MTLSTSENHKSVRKLYFFKRVLPYLLVTFLCLMFSFIYAQFSHGVHSPHMTYLFLYPLCLGVGTGTLCMFFSKEKPLFLASHLYHTGVAALILSSLLHGIFDIAGTASPYQTALTILGLVMILVAGLHLFIKKLYLKNFTGDTAK